MKQFFIAVLVFCVTFVPTSLKSEMSGGDFSIAADSVTFFDGVSSTGGDYSLEGSGEPVAAGTSSGGDYTLAAGFYAAIEGTLTFTVSDTALSLGTFSLTEVVSGSVTTTVTTDSLTGYSLTLTEDGNLRDGSNDIDDVSDGEVSVGSEEYGVTTSGADAQISTDVAIDGSLELAASSAPSSAETTVTFKGALSTSSRAGSYAHTLTFTATANP